MKKIKVTEPFWFKDMSHQKMAESIDADLPINLKYNEDLVSRVHDRYPIIEKYKVALIIKTIFQSIRYLLIMGKILNFHNLFFNTKFHFFEFRKSGHILPALRVKISTPPKLRKL